MHCKVCTANIKLRPCCNKRANARSMRQGWSLIFREDQTFQVSKWFITNYGFFFKKINKTTLMAVQVKSLSFALPALRACILLLGILRFDFFQRHHSCLCCVQFNFFELQTAQEAMRSISTAVPGAFLSWEKNPGWVWSRATHILSTSKWNKCGKMCLRFILVHI